MHRPDAIAIGCSQGGFSALRIVLGGLDPRLPQPVLVCCHTSSDITILCELLTSYCALPVVEACERQLARGGRVHIAPGGYHLLVEKNRRFALSVDAVVRYSRPSIDVLFSSAADVYMAGLIGVILTGANPDGAEGMARIRGRGGIAVVQTPESSESPVMPRAALEVAGADYCVPLEQIAPLLNRLCIA